MSGGGRRGRDTQDQGGFSKHALNEGVLVAPYAVSVQNSAKAGVYNGSSIRYSTTSTNHRASGMERGCTIVPGRTKRKAQGGGEGGRKREERGWWGKRNEKRG